MNSTRLIAYFMRIILEYWATTYDEHIIITTDLRRTLDLTNPYEEHKAESDLKVDECDFFVVVNEKV